MTVNYIQVNRVGSFGEVQNSNATIAPSDEVIVTFHSDDDILDHVVEHVDRKEDSSLYQILDPSSFHVVGDLFICGVRNVHVDTTKPITLYIVRKGCIDIFTIDPNWVAVSVAFVEFDRPGVSLKVIGNPGSSEDRDAN